MKGRITVSVLILLLAAVGAGADLGASFTEVDGDVLLKERTASEGTPAVEGEAVPSGVFIDVAEGSRAVITFDDGHVTSLGPRATLARYSEGRLRTVTLTLFRGYSEHRVSPLEEGASYRVVTPVAVAGVRGTEFAVGVADDGSAFTVVKEGEVGIGDDPDEPDAVVESGKEYTGSIGGEGEVKDATLDDEDEKDGWYAEKEADLDEDAGEVTQSSAADISRTRSASAGDFAMIAGLAARVAEFTRRGEISSGDVADAAEVLADGLRLFRRSQARKDRIEAQRYVALRLNEDYGADISSVEEEYSAYDEEYSSNSDGLENLIGALETLSTLIRTAETVESINDSPVGDVVPVPHFGW